MISVLYADDEPALLEIGKIYLEQTGDIAVDTVSSAPEALDKLRCGSYDAVVSDYQMPGMDGIAFLKIFRKEYPSLPFLIFTGKGREEVAIAAFENGADFYVQKGGEPKSQFAELAHKIRKSVTQRKAERALKESEIRFRSLIQNSSDIIRILNTEGKIIYDSPSTTRILGYPEGFFIGKSPLDFIHPDDREMVKLALNEVMYGKNPGTPTEFRVLDARGNYISVESVATNLTENRAIGGIVTTTRSITDRKKGEQALRESEERFRDLYENAPNAYYSVNTEGRIVLCNHQAGLILGLPCKQLIERRISSFYADTPLGKDRAKKIFSGFKNGMDISGEELQMQRADGKIIWISLTVNGVRNTAGEITESRTIVKDITARKTIENELLRKNDELQVACEQITSIEEELRQNYNELKNREEAIRASEERFRLVVDTAPDAIFIQTGGRFAYVNPAAIRLFGASSAEDLLGIPVPDRFHPAFRDVIRERIRKLNDERIPVEQLEEICLRLDSSAVDVEVSAVPIRYQEMNGALVFARDISARKQDRRRFIESQRRFENLVQNLPGMVYRCRNDAAWTMEFVSEGSTGLTGYTPKELIENAVIGYGSLIHPEDRDLVWEMVQDALKNKKLFQLVYRITDRCGNLRWVWEQGRGTFNEQGEPVYLEGYISDISGQKKVQVIVDQITEKFALLNSITQHDAGNKISALMARLELMKEGITDPKQRDEISRMVQIADDLAELFAFTRVYQEIGLKNPQWQEITSLVNNLHAGPLRIVSDVAGLKIFADPLLSKVFTNLLDNTVRHGGQVTTVTITATKTGSGLVLSWEDDGVGIEQADKERIFDRNFGKNTGLGLFLVREILSLTGITVKENGVPGRGARFEITVPEGAYRFT